MFYSPETLARRRSTRSEMVPVICVHCAPLERARLVSRCKL